MDPESIMKLRIKASVAFRPGTPIDQYSLFVGRFEQVKDVVDATMQSGRHVILFGERGVGKTSLAKVISQILQSSGIKLLDSGTINCDPTDDFSLLWKKIFREFSYTLTKPSKTTGFSENQNEVITEKSSFEKYLPEKVTPDDIRYVFKYIPERSIIIIDELDRIQNKEVTTLLADTIKSLSDHSINTTLILVGVGNSVSDLIQEHKSIERALVQVPMPRMSIQELTEIIDKALSSIGMDIEENAKYWITELSQGLPHYTHSLGLYSTLDAIDQKRVKITLDNVSSATKKLVQKSYSILNNYNTATSSPHKKNIYRQVLLSCALAKKNSLGLFSASSIIDPLSKIMQKHYKIASFAKHLFHFCENKFGSILEKNGPPRRLRYRFADPMMQAFIIINGFAEGLLDQDIMEKVKNDN